MCQHPGAARLLNRSGGVVVDSDGDRDGDGAERGRAQGVDAGAIAANGHIGRAGNDACRRGGEADVQRTGIAGAGRHIRCAAGGRDHAAGNRPGGRGQHALRIRVRRIGVGYRQRLGHDATAVADMQDSARCRHRRRGVAIDVAGHDDGRLGQARAGAGDRPVRPIRQRDGAALGAGRGVVHADSDVRAVGAAGREAGDRAVAVGVTRGQADADVQSVGRRRRRVGDRQCLLVVRRAAGCDMRVRKHDGAVGADGGDDHRDGGDVGRHQTQGGAAVTVADKLKLSSGGIARNGEGQGPAAEDFGDQRAVGDHGGHDLRTGQVERVVQAEVQQRAGEARGVVQPQGGVRAVEGHGLAGGSGQFEGRAGLDLERAGTVDGPADSQ